jgi:hypothetical protein
MYKILLVFLSLFIYNLFVFWIFILPFIAMILHGENSFASSYMCNPFLQLFYFLTLLVLSCAVVKGLKIS